MAVGSVAASVAAFTGQLIVAGPELRTVAMMVGSILAAAIAWWSGREVSRVSVRESSGTEAKVAQRNYRVLSLIGGLGLLSSAGAFSIAFFLRGSPRTSVDLPAGSNDAVEVLGAILCLAASVALLSRVAQAAAGLMWAGVFPATHRFRQLVRGLIWNVRGILCATCACIMALGLAPFDALWAWRLCDAGAVVLVLLLVRGLVRTVVLARARA